MIKIGLRQVLMFLGIQLFVLFIPGLIIAEIFGCLIVANIAIFCILYFTFKRLYTIVGINIQTFASTFLSRIPMTFNKPSRDKPSELKNMNLICYMNSLIQALASSNRLIEMLKTLQKDSQIPNTILDIFIKLLTDVNDPESNIDENSEHLLKLIGKIEWHKSDQQDSYDLLSKIMNSIEREVKANSNENDIKIPLKIKMVYIFQGIEITNRVQYHLGLSLGLCGNFSDFPGVTLEDLVRAHFDPVTIDDEPSKTSQIFFYKEAPTILLFHIQANKWDMDQQKMIKPEYYIQYPHQLNLNLNISDDLGKKINKEEADYELCAVVHHFGDVSGGHYVTYRKLKAIWYRINDEQVSKIKFDCEVCPYLLIYEKTD